MKWLFALSLLALSLAAAAEETGVNSEQLQNAVSLGAVLDDKVMTEDEREIGELADVLLRMNGELEEYLIRFEPPGDNYNRGTTTFRDDVADYGEAPFYEGESVEGELQPPFLAASPEQIVFERRNDDVVIVNLGKEGLSSLVARDERRFAQREFVRATVVVGMDVDVADEESFGTIEDILLTENGDAIAAYVVDSWDGLDKRRHALPADAVQLVPVKREEAIREKYGVAGVKLNYTRDQVAELPEFDRDR